MNGVIVAHVTHEAVRKVGGIGTVLEGLLNAPAYRRAVARSVLVGPLFDHQTAGDRRLGNGGNVLYSTLDGIDRGTWSERLGPVASEYGVGLVYGTRPLVDEWSGRRSEVEVLLVDVAGMDPAHLADFKFRLFESFGIRSERFDFLWDYEQYVRLAPPGLAALRRLVGEGDEPIAIQAHEFMGIPFALAARLDGDPRLATIHHAHEVATVRRLVEEHPGHDTRFYAAMARWRAEGLTIDDVFGPQDAYFKHELSRAGRHADSVLAVGELVRQELQFLDLEFARRPIDYVPNGIPAADSSIEERTRSREMLLDYAGLLLGWRPDLVFTHVARLVASKAFWRDVRVLEELEPLLVRRGRSAVLFVVATEGAIRSIEDVRRMEADRRWPWNHRVGYPDLTGAEIGLDQCFQEFNRSSRAIKIVLVNQFGWDPSALGDRLPRDMTFVDLRRGTDLEFGQSIYEPFGISQLESLTYGAVSVASSVCGCVAFARAQAPGGEPPGLVAADYVTWPAGWAGPDDPRSISRTERDALELRVAGETAGRILAALEESSPLDRLVAGRELARAMSWDVVATDYYLPALRSALHRAARRPSRVG